MSESFWEHAHHIVAADFCSNVLKEKGQGVNGLIVASDANKHPVIASFLRFYGNENKDSWDLLFGLSRDAFDFDSDGSFVFTDGAKGATASVHEMFTSAGHLLDERHHKLALATTRNGGKEAAEAYDDIFRSAPDQRTIDLKKSELAENVRAILERNPDTRLYPGAVGGVHGRTCGSYVEGYNATLLEEGLRSLPGALQLGRVMEHCQKRFVKLQADSANEDEPLPERIREIMNRRFLAAAKIPDSSVRFSDQEQTRGTCKSTVDPNTAFSFDLTEIEDAGMSACECGVTLMSGLPCKHLIKAAQKAGSDIYDLMNSNDTTAGWKAQYEDFEFLLPTAAQIEAHQDLVNINLRYPPVLRPKQGRPSAGKRKRNFLERLGGAPKRQLTCKRCFKKGHNKKSCPERA